VLGLLAMLEGRRARTAARALDLLDFLTTAVTPKGAGGVANLIGDEGVSTRGRQRRRLAALSAPGVCPAARRYHPGVSNAALFDPSERLNPFVQAIRAGV